MQRSAPQCPSIGHPLLRLAALELGAWPPPHLQAAHILTLDVQRQFWHESEPMIQSYRDKKTEQFARGEFVRAFKGFEDQAARRLSILNAAPSLDTLRALPGNRLEALKGDRAGQYSIRINLQWRICFEWPDGQSGPSNVEIVDYH